MAQRLIPYSRHKARWLSPAWIRDTTSSRIPTGYFFIPFFPDILRPPNVVLFSYIRGPFVYCPFLLDLFTLCVPFRDKYGLSDLQTLRIARKEMSLMEMLQLLGLMEEE